VIHAVLQLKEGEEEGCEENAEENECNHGWSFEAVFSVSNLKLVKGICQQALQKGKDAHDDCDFKPVFSCGEFEACFAITESTDVVVDEVFEEIDDEIGEE